MVWIVTYDDMNSGVVWDDENAAYKAICSEIIDDINNGWDFNDPATLTAAQEIEKFIQSQRWQEAVTVWNDWSSMYDVGIYWNVVGEHVWTSTSAPNPLTINWPAKDDDATDTLTSGPFVATASGATCRGPCGSWNEYACADKADGTFVCYQCKMFDGSIK